MCYFKETQVPIFGFDSKMAFWNFDSLLRQTLLMFDGLSWYGNAVYNVKNSGATLFKIIGLVAVSCLLLIYSWTGI